jgi:uncharacterized membrane protein YpjA
VVEADIRQSPAQRLRDLWVRFARWVVMSPVVWLIVVADLGGALAGYIYWYGDSILATPWYFWLFVPDCPLAATFMGIALLAFHYGRRWDFLGLLATGTCVKYGLWTVVFWAANKNAGGLYHFEAVTMSATHLIMIIEGLLLTTFLRFRLLPVAAASLFLIAGDLVDYASSYHPRLGKLVSLGFMGRFSVIMTAIIVASWIVMVWVSAQRSRARGGPAGGVSAGGVSVDSKGLGNGGAGNESLGGKGAK